MTDGPSVAADDQIRLDLPARAWATAVAAEGLRALARRLDLSAAVTDTLGEHLSTELRAQAANPCEVVFQVSPADVGVRVGRAGHALVLPR